jgi:hypothetical protein
MVSPSGLINHCQPFVGSEQGLFIEPKRLIHEWHSKLRRSPS